MLDKDLSELYQVETKALIQAVKRNNNRFPKDFMFQLTKEEVISLRSQNVILNDHVENKVVANLKSQIATSSWQTLRYLTET